MANHERYFVRQSIQDVIGILHGQPVRADMIPQIAIVQVMNRISIAHLSIERAMKFLIAEAGGNFEQNHDLPAQLEDLSQHAPEAAEFLEEAFQAAVQHYRFNPNAANMGYLKYLKEYLKATGSDKTFQNIRYWELSQSLNERTLRQVRLPLHIELLHALEEILLSPKRPMNTVMDRVERATRYALMRSARGTSNKESADSYTEWLREHGNYRDAMATAVKRKFKIGDAYAGDSARKAYLGLTESSDLAVRYFANTLDILPGQPRNAIPCVEWLGPEEGRHGEVSTPGGTNLGFIDRGLDSLWYITPSRDGLVKVSAIAESQTDARCYLSNLLTQPARIRTEAGEMEVRIVGEEFDAFLQDYHTEIYKVTFWDENHNLQEGQQVTIDTRARKTGEVIYVLEGTVIEIAGSEVSISGVHSVRPEEHSEEG